MSELFERIRRLGIAAWSLLGAIALVWVIGWAAVAVKIIWPPLVLAGILVYVLNPLVGRFERVGLHRVLGSCLSYLLALSLLTVAISLVVPLFSDQVAAFTEELPTIVEDFAAWLTDLGDRFGVTFGAAPTWETIQQWLADPENQARIQEFVGGGLEVVRRSFEAVVLILLAPVLALYILVDVPRLSRSFRELMPPDIRAEVVFVAHQAGRAIGGFVRGQVLVALIVGILSSIGLRLIGLPFWLVIGTIAGVLNLVPFIGPWVGGMLAAIVALVLGDLTMALLSVVVMATVQQIDNHLISPLILRVTVKLHPVVIVLALLVWGSLAGFLGILIAVPATAAGKIVLGHLWRTRVLGESWEQAAEAMIEEREPSRDALLTRFRSIRDMEVHAPYPHEHPFTEDDARSHPDDAGSSDDDGVG